MPNHQTYFSNHGKAAKFPWSLYHGPLIRSLQHFFEKQHAQAIQTVPSVLVIGPGDLHELPMLDHFSYETSIADVDERTLDRLKRLHPDKIKNAYLVQEDLSGYPLDAKFDAIYAKEVIEHIVDSPAFLAQLKSLLKPGGRIWLSTPNYGFFLLPFLEASFLEVVARLSGFTRKGIHPNKFNPEKLKQELKDAGFQDTSIEVTPGKLALCGTGTNNSSI